MDSQPECHLTHLMNTERYSLDQQHTVVLYVLERACCDSAELCWLELWILQHHQHWRLFCLPFNTHLN